jgi:hypothetical protein
MRSAPLFAFLLPLLVVHLNQVGIPAGPPLLALFFASQIVASRATAHARAGSLQTA